ncbi:hypothetical protein BJ322DRAFT_992716, partial [Thelephora terrestris]
PSHLMVAVYPRPPPANKGGAIKDESWTIEFKSIRIAKKAIKKMWYIEDTTLRELYNHYRNIPQNSSFAGRLFELIIHRMLSRGWQSEGDAPKLIHMAASTGDPPVFSSVSPSESSTPNTQPHTLASPFIRVRNATPVNLTGEITCVTLDKDAYYFPDTTNNPLFDSFIIDADQDPAVISIIQITTSTDHGGSAEGYPLIRKLM